MVLYRDFCLQLCSETKENKELIEIIYTLPEDIRDRIFNEFSTRVLCNKIHPVDFSEIRMASFAGYRKFCRSNRDSVGRYTNKSRLRTLLHIYMFMDASHSPITMSELIWYHYRFYPSIKFLKYHVIPLINSLCFRPAVKQRLISEIYTNHSTFIPPDD